VIPLKVDIMAFILHHSAKNYGIPSGDSKSSSVSGLGNSNTQLLKEQVRAICISARLRKLGLHYHCNGEPSKQKHCVKGFQVDWEAIFSFLKLILGFGPILAITDSRKSGWIQSAD